MVLSHEIQFIGFEIVLNLAESSLESLTSSRIWAGPEFAQPVRRQAVKGHRLSLWQKSTPPTTFQLVMGLHILNTLPPSWQFFFLTTAHKGLVVLQPSMGFHVFNCPAVS